MLKKIGIGLIILGAIFLIGCGDDAEEGVVEGEELAGEEAEAALEENTWDLIQERGEFTFAMTGAYPPFNFLDEEGELIGFDIDIANAIAQEMGVQAVGITVTWDGIITGLNNGRFDSIIGSMAITEDRMEQVNFSDPYYYDGAQFFGHEDVDAESLHDMDSPDVGVVTGTTFHEYLQDEVEGIGNIMQFESDVDNMRAVQQGRSDGLVTALLVGLNGIDEHNMPLKPVGEPLYVEEIAIALRQDDEELRDVINDALAAIIEDGTYAEISEKWFGTNILDLD